AVALCVPAAFASQAGAAAAVAADTSATVHVLYPVSPSTWDPGTVLGGASTARNYWKPVYETLVKVANVPGGGTKLVGMLASSFSTSADAKTIEFKLRPGVKFQDGAPFDSNAVK